MARTRQAGAGREVGEVVSEVTDYLLTFSESEEACGHTEGTIDGMPRRWSRYRCLDAINAELAQLGQTPFANLDSCFAGKVCGAAVWGASLNHFPLTRMAPLVEQRPWHLWECVRLLVKHEDESGMLAHALNRQFGELIRCESLGMTRKDEP